MSFDHKFRLTLVGDSNVGKSSIILHFTEGQFQENVKPTAVDSYKVKNFKVDLAGDVSTQVKLAIWDIASHENMRSTSPMYYAGIDGVILVFDLSQMESFLGLRKWASEVEQYCADRGEHSVVRVVVGNIKTATNTATSSSLPSTVSSVQQSRQQQQQQLQQEQQQDRCVSRAEAEEWALSRGMLYTEISSRSSDEVHALFAEVARRIIEQQAARVNARRSSLEETLLSDRAAAGKKERNKDNFCSKCFCEIC